MSIAFGGGGEAGGPALAGSIGGLIARIDLVFQCFLFVFFKVDESLNSEDVDFNWDEYLEETGSTAAPHTSFKHVCILLRASSPHY